MAEEMNLNEMTEEEVELEFDDAEEEIDATDELVTPINPSTIARCVVLLLVLINQVLVVCGKTPFNLDESAVYDFISMSLTGIMSLWTAWKNNSFTKKARKADLVKNGVID